MAKPTLTNPLGLPADVRWGSGFGAIVGTLIVFADPKTVGGDPVGIANTIARRAAIGSLFGIVVGALAARAVTRRMP